MRFAIPVLATLAALLIGCSSAAPTAPIGLNKRPANTADAVARLARPPAELTAAASVPNGPPPAVASNDPTKASVHAFPGLIILSDQSAPRGIASLTPDQRAELLTAARSARRIRIYCRGDRSRPSKAVHARLLQRGEVIKRWLVGQGVAPALIRVFVRSAGAFVADNSTSLGRAQNRRVEIQFS